MTDWSRRRRAVAAFDASLAPAIIQFQKHFASRNEVEVEIENHRPGRGTTLYG